jgi:hypothetical protein
MNPRKAIPVVVTALVAVCASAAVATAAESKGRTGTWSGKTSQDLAELEEPYSVRISISALNGRLQTIATTVRMECPGPSVQDIRILKSFVAGKGPALSDSGGFTVRISGVSISGRLGLRNASGRFDVSKGGCSGKGSWSAKRRL